MRHDFRSRNAMSRCNTCRGSSSRSSEASGTSGFNEYARKVNDSLYELYRPEGTPSLQIIFFHGLQPGDYSDAHLSTWQSGDGSCFWPQTWLVEEFPTALVLSVSYGGGLRKSSDGSGGMYIIGENLLSDLLQVSSEEDWHCPVVLVGHSIGGLVIKEVCCRAHAKLNSSQGSERAKLETFLKKVRGIFYYASPYHGSEATKGLAKLKPSPMLKYFTTLSKHTALLNSNFEQICKVHYQWLFAGLGETLPTDLGPFEEFVIPEASARGEDSNLVEGADHYSICRPRCKSVRSFSKLKDFLCRITSASGDAHLQRVKPKTLAPLPFVPDPKYVPISDSILEAVQKALENVEGPHVVTICGEPGMGKSSLVKYVALLYEEQRKQWMDSSSDKTDISFPDGVQYLFCGQGAKDRIKQLMLNLLQGVEFGSGSAPPPNNSTAAAKVQAWKLRSCLAKQKLLIILDDLWEEEVLPELVFGAEGVKYLIASQRKEIWGDAEKIHLERPTMTEARRIMANYTTGLPKKGEFPDNVQTVTDDIIKALEYHPLSLANVGMSIIGSRATDASHWEVIKKDLQVLLDDDTVENFPLSYARPYNLTVGASMKLLVESVPFETRKLLYMMALLETPVPEYLVKFFYKSIQTTKFDGRYSDQLKYLEDRSLIEVPMQGKVPMLATHGLRIHYIREKRNPEVRSLAAQMLDGSPDSVFVIMGAMHFAQPFLDLVTILLQYHIRVINNGVLPRRLESCRDSFALVTEIRRHTHQFRPLFGLLSPDRESYLERKAHDFAKKIMFKVICQEELDDASMASLLRLPQTNSKIRNVIKDIFFKFGAFQMAFSIAFVPAYVETMKAAVLALLQSDWTAANERDNVIRVLSNVHAFETEDSIVSVVEVWKLLHATHSEPTLQIACRKAFNSNENRLQFRGTPKRLMESTDFWEIPELLVAVLVSGKESFEVRLSAAWSIRECLYDDMSRNAFRRVDSSNAQEKLLKVFLSRDTHRELRSCAGQVLYELSCVPENRIELGAVRSGLLEALVDILAEMDWDWTAHPQTRSGDVVYLKPCAVTAAEILGNLALTKELRKTIARLPNIVERLLFVQPIEMILLVTELGRPYPFHLASTRALTILRSMQVDPRITDLPPLCPFPEKHWSGNNYVELRLLPAVATFWFYMSRVHTYLEMGSYTDALADLDLADLYLKQISPSGPAHRPFGLNVPSQEFEVRHLRIFCQAMLAKDDRAGVISVINNYIETHLSKGPNVCLLRNRAVLQMLSRDLEAALGDLNISLQEGLDMNRPNSKFPRSSFLKYDTVDILHLIEDNAGVKGEESTQRWKLDQFRGIDDNLDFWELGKLGNQPLNYSGAPSNFLLDIMG